VTTESSVDAKLAIEQTRLLRLPVALTLLLVNLFWLLIAVERFLIPRERLDPAPGFGERARASFDDFAGLAPILLPLVAVLLVTLIAPAVVEAKLIMVAALTEYALSGLFAVIAFLAGFSAPGHGGRSLVEDGFTGFGSLILLGVVTFLVFRIAQALFRGEKPDRFAAYGQGAVTTEAPRPNTAPLPPHYAAPPGQAYGFQPHGVAKPVQPPAPPPETPDD
jgi:hypothetical protein